MAGNRAEVDPPALIRRLLLGPWYQGGGWVMAGVVPPDHCHISAYFEPLVCPPKKLA
jgi:hypothetical protein